MSISLISRSISRANGRSPHVLSIGTMRKFSLI